MENYWEQIKMTILMLTNIEKPIKVFNALKIDNEAFRDIEDIVLKESLQFVSGFIVASIEEKRHDIIEKLDQEHFESAIHAVVPFLINKKKALAFQSLFLLADNGLQKLKDKIFRTQDDASFMLVYYFLQFIEIKISLVEIEKKTKDLVFLYFIYINLIEKMFNMKKMFFINQFQNYAIQLSPNTDERKLLGMPMDGICHGSCLFAALFACEENSRSEILSHSCQLQKEYLKCKDPSSEIIFDNYISSIIENLDKLKDENKPPNEIVRNLIQGNSKDFQEFSKENGINLNDLFLESMKISQQIFIENHPEFGVFENYENILNNEKLSPETHSIILNYLGQRILDTVGAKKHIILITLEEKADITLSMNELKKKFRLTQFHDVLLRVDMNLEGNIKHLIFCDLQEVGIFLLKAEKSSLFLRDSIGDSFEIIKSYVRNVACIMFEKITAKYINNI